MTLNELQEDSNQPLRINWFRQMLVEARGERMFPVFRARERRNRNGRDGAEPLQEPVSVLIGHASPAGRIVPASHGRAQPWTQAHPPPSPRWRTPSPNGAQKFG